MAIELTELDVAQYLASAEDQAALLEDAISSGDAGYVAHALDIIARARGMEQAAPDVGAR